MPFKAVAVACLLLFGFAGVAAANEYDDYEKIRLDFVAENYSKVIPAATKLLESENISQKRRANLLTFRGAAFNELDQHAKGLEDLSNSLALASKPFQGEIRYYRFYSYYNLDRKGDAYKDMLIVAQDYPEDAQNFSISNITKVAKDLTKKNMRNELFALLSALDSSKYTGVEPLEFTDKLYVDLLREYVKRQRFEDARRVLANFTQARELINVRLDRDFEALWSRPEFAQLLDMQDFPARELANAQALLAKYPNSWKAVADTVNALRMNGRNEDAVGMAKSAFEKSGTYQFDQDYKLWLKNELAYALQALGRADEASAVMESTTRSNLKKDENPVNQILNYGAMLMARGETQKAIRVVQKTEGFLSNRGSLVVKYVTACSMQQTNRTDEARSILTDMLVNDDGGVDVVIKTLACLNETEQLAQYAIKQLADEKEKLKVLRMLTKCDINPLAPAMDSEIEKRLASLHERPDVNKAVAAVGTALTLPGSCSDF